MKFKVTVLNHTDPREAEAALEEAGFPSVARAGTVTVAVEAEDEEWARAIVEAAIGKWTTRVEDCDK